MDGDDDGEQRKVDDDGGSEAESQEDPLAVGHSSGDEPSETDPVTNEPSGRTSRTLLLLSLFAGLVVGVAASSWVWGILVGVFLFIGLVYVQYQDREGDTEGFPAVALRSVARGTSRLGQDLAAEPENERLAESERSSPSGWAVLGVFALVGFGMGAGTVISSWAFEGGQLGAAALAGIALVFALPLGIVVAAIGGHYMSNSPEIPRGQARITAGIAEAVGHFVLIAALALTLMAGFSMLADGGDSTTTGTQTADQEAAAETAADWGLLGRLSLSVIPAGIIGAGVAHIFYRGPAESPGSPG